MKAALTSIAIVLLLLPASAAGQSDYVIGPQDVLAINVFNETELGGKYTVEADGTFSFPLVGRVKAGGRTLRQFEEDLKTLLADGFYKQPQVAVTVEEYRSQRIIVMGEVREPGPYPLTGDMTLIEALSKVGATENASDEIVILRGSDGNGQASAADTATPDVITVDIAKIQKGDLSRNVRLRDGDTIIVSRREETDFIYVYGEVKQPGVFTIKPNTTVLQALSLAGGLTPEGADGRIRILRMVQGKKKELKAKLDDIVQRGDTLVVPQRFF